MLVDDTPAESSAAGVRSPPTWSQWPWIWAQLLHHEMLWLHEQKRQGDELGSSMQRRQQKQQQQLCRRKAGSERSADFAALVSQSGCHVELLPPCGGRRKSKPGHQSISAQDDTVTDIADPSLVATR